MLELRSLMIMAHILSIYYDSAHIRLALFTETQPANLIMELSQLELIYSNTKQAGSTRQLLSHG